ncbi:cation:proton antiporter family protein [Halodesulfovibrio marinisediminis]|uniref:Transporter, CPA2 family n=1 Tax=Halodesulfovibrio marinisediminis DSM 17456 TaxID=1121457 RepID=A0A1N6E996_9BACT|nr:cation:proton antiporter family protein [Halodesulfovibrio marinisediminis]SIN79531.1 transporter, CPA2 family [Halodesulfovibrio marinisediminis DSM 17456]
MDPVILSVTFIFGLLANRAGLPALTGFLIAGFILNAMGFTASETIQQVGDLGVTLLLFTIGLKLKIRQLLRPEIWAVGSIHMLVTVLFLGFGIHLVAATVLGFFTDFSLEVSLLVAFALSFSSTVFAVKILEENGLTDSLNGRIAIGILIIQDILAVLFITFSTGKIPSLWALLVIALLPVARIVFRYILDHTGHGELQVLFGMALALAIGAGSFELVGLKADLGALIMGMLLATHPKAEELADSLLSIKDFMLLGFFLSIGLRGFPDMATLGIAALFVLFIPLKSALFFFLFTRFNLSARTSFITAVNLTNYSEFGLIVGAIGVSNGWLDSSWLVVLAIALSLSFIVASPLNVQVEELFERWRYRLTQFETEKSHPDEEHITLTVPWQVVIVGMGRVGTQTYDALRKRFGNVILGVDSDQDKVKQHNLDGREVIYADVSDGDFWRRLVPIKTVQMGVLTIPDLDAKLYAMTMAKEKGVKSKIVAITEYDDEIEPLLRGGADYAFNIYDEIGIGLACEIRHCLNESNILIEKLDEITGVGSMKPTPPKHPS